MPNEDGVGSSGENVQEQEIVQGFWLAWRNDDKIERAYCKVFAEGFSPQQVVELLNSGEAYWVIDGDWIVGPVEIFARCDVPYYGFEMEEFKGSFFVDDRE